MIGRKHWIVDSSKWVILLSETATNNEPRTTKNTQRGFSLLEMIIAMFIMIILLSVAIPTYRTSIQHAKEVTLMENLSQMRRAIEQYTSDKAKTPQSLQDLIDAKYLRDKPKDPITEETEWQEISGDDPNSAEGEQGLVDVKSLADGEDSYGKPYSDY